MYRTDYAQAEMSTPAAKIASRPVRAWVMMAGKLECRWASPDALKAARAA